MPGAVICVRHAPCGSTPSFPMSILITFVLLRIILFCLFVYFPTFVCVHVCMHVCMYVLYCKKKKSTLIGSPPLVKMPADPSCPRLLYSVEYFWPQWTQFVGY